MGFIFGLLVGTALSTSGTGSTAPPLLGSIPLRCLAALEVSEAEYRHCREPSLSMELYGSGNGPSCGRIDREGNGVCSIARHLTWEIAALKHLEQATQAQQKGTTK